MDLQELEQLVAGGESDRLEFKRSTGELREAMQTLCGFVNEQGGRALIGVTNSGRILGQQVADTTLQDVAREIQKFEPPVQVRQKVVPVRENLSVLILEVDVGDDGPHQFDGRVFQRIGTTTQRMPAVEYERRLLARLHSHHRWENRVAENYGIDDLDLEEIQRTHRIAAEVIISTGLLALSFVFKCLGDIPGVTIHVIRQNRAERSTLRQGCILRFNCGLRKPSRFSLG